jgi:hypothetical protein
MPHADIFDKIANFCAMGRVYQALTLIGKDRGNQAGKAQQPCGPIEPAAGSVKTGASRKMRTPDTHFSIRCN